MKRKTPHFLSSRRFKHGTMATVLTIVVVAAVVLVNVIVSLLLGLFPSSVDLTSDSRFQLGDESIEYVQGLDNDITITVCAKESDFTGADSYGYYYQANEIIKQYAQYNSHISVQYVDLLEDPTFSANYSSYSLSEYDIIVESGDRIRVVDPSDLITTEINDDYTGYDYYSDAEKIMSKAISYVSASTLSTAAVITGHSEATGTDSSTGESLTTLTGLQTILEDNNFELVSVDLGTASLDDSYSLVIICAPMVDYTAEEINQIDAFLTNDGKFGKTLLYVASYQQISLSEDGSSVSTLTPNLDAFLAEWGIEVSLDGVMYETDTSNAYGGSSYGGYVMGMTLNDEDREANLRDASLPVIGMYTRPVNQLFESNDNITTTALIQSTDSTTLYPYINSDAESFVASHYGTYNGAVLSQKTYYEGTTPFSSSVLAVGSDGFFASSVIGSAKYNNNQYFVNLLSDLTGQEGGLNISSVSFTTETFTATDGAAMSVMVVFMFAVPMAALAGGFVFWATRRRK